MKWILIIYSFIIGYIVLITFFWHLLFYCLVLIDNLLFLLLFPWKVVFDFLRLLLMNIREVRVWVFIQLFVWLVGMHRVILKLIWVVLWVEQLFIYCFRLFTTITVEQELILPWFFKLVINIRKVWIWWL